MIVLLSEKAFACENLWKKLFTSDQFPFIIIL
jgi:hypothetical protein